MLRTICRSIFIVLLVIIFTGCSGGDGSPTAPPDDGSLPGSRESAESSHVLWGIWGMSLDLGGNTITIQQYRSPQAHFDITDMLTPPNCDDCLVIKVLEYKPAEKYAKINVILSNPTPMKGYDVRGILLSNAEEMRLLNADSYTNLWDDGGDVTINPFKAFATDQPSRVFSPDTSHARAYKIEFPSLLELINAILIVDASWPSNCKEPYEIGGFNQETNIPADGGATDVSLNVYDWQFDANGISIDASPIGGNLVELTYNQGFTWEGTIETAETNSPGFHRLLVYAESEGTLVQLYNYVDVYITACTPEGNETWQNATLLPIGEDTGEQFVCLEDKADWYKFNVQTQLYGEIKLKLSNDTGKADLTFYSDPEGPYIKWVEADFGSEGVIGTTPFEPGPGTYYLRVRHIGNDIEARNYTLFNDTGDSVCIPDGNDSYLDAIEIAFGESSGTQYVCSVDKEDWFKFIYTESEGHKIRLSIISENGPGDITLYSEEQAPDPSGPFLAWKEANPTATLHLDPLGLESSTYYVRIRHIGSDADFRGYRVYNYGTDLPCEPEGNETWENATELPMGENSDIQVVCEDDKYDWYKFTADFPIIGEIRLTLLNDTGISELVLYSNPMGDPKQSEDAEYDNDAVIDLEPLELDAGEYYIRVAHVGSDLYVRQYILSNDAGYWPCQPEGNEDWWDAFILPMGNNTGEQEVCRFDEIDWYKFVPPGQLIGDITLELINDTGTCEVAFYDDTDDDPLLTAEATFGSNAVLDIESVEIQEGNFHYIKVTYLGSDDFVRDYVLYNNTAPWPCEPDGNETWESADWLSEGKNSKEQEVCIFDLADWYKFSIGYHMYGELRLTMLSEPGSCSLGFYIDPQSDPVIYGEASYGNDVILDVKSLNLDNGTYYMKVGYIGDDYITREYILYNDAEDVQCYPEGNDSYLTAIPVPISGYSDREYVCLEDEEDWFKFEYTGDIDCYINLLVDNDTGPAELTLYSETQAPSPSGPNLAQVIADPKAKIDLTPLSLSPGTYYARVKFIGTDKEFRECIVGYVSLDGGWARDWYQPDRDDRTWAIAANPDGEIFVGGEHELGWIDIDPGPGFDHQYSYGGMFLIKFDKGGEYLWSYREEAALIRQIQSDDAGDFYIAGEATSPVDLDFGPGVELFSGGSGIFITKYTSEGDYVWGGMLTGGDKITELKLDQMGNIYCCGFYKPTIDLDPGPGEDKRTAIDGYDCWVVKLDNDGNFIWGASFGGKYDDEANALALNSTQISIVGDFEEDIDLDPSAGVAEYETYQECNGFITTLSISGDYLWSGAYGSNTKWDVAMAAEYDGGGNVYIGGYFYGTSDLDPTGGVDEHVSEGGYDAHLIKLNSSGDFLWAKTFGAGGTDYINGILFNGAGSFYIRGAFSELVDFDFGSGVSYLLSNGDIDVFMGLYDTNANLQYVQGFGGIDRDTVYDLEVDADGNIYLGGYFRESVDFDPGGTTDFHTINDDEDQAYLLKYLPGGVW